MMASLIKTTPLLNATSPVEIVSVTVVLAPMFTAAADAASEKDLAKRLPSRFKVPTL